MFSRRTFGAIPELLRKSITINGIGENAFEEPTVKRRIFRKNLFLRVRDTVEIVRVSRRIASATNTKEIVSVLKRNTFRTFFEATSLLTNWR